MRLICRGLQLNACGTRPDEIVDRTSHPVCTFIASNFLQAKGHSGTERPHWTSKPLKINYLLFVGRVRCSRAFCAHGDGSEYPP
jgi:hypothetical protein